MFPSSNKLGPGIPHRSCRAGTCGCSRNTQTQRYQIVLCVQTESSFRLFSGSRGTDDGSDVEVFHLIHPLGSFAPDASSPATARIICSTTSELSLCSRCSSSLSDSRGLSLFLRKEDELTTVHGAAQLPSDAMPLRRVEVHLPGHDVV